MLNQIIDRMSSAETKPATGGKSGSERKPARGDEIEREAQRDACGKGQIIIHAQGRQRIIGPEERP